MARHLVFLVHLHDRFHGMAFGAPEWPPSPARVFQALLAGVGRGKGTPAQSLDALRWLETLSPPRIGAARAKLGTEQLLYVPNNDLDAKGGDPSKVSDIRVAKRLIPRLVDTRVPLLYIWSWEGATEHVAPLVEAAEKLYQLGRGVDAAWARAEEIDDAALDDLLAAYAGTIHVPSLEAGARGGLQCPVPGSLDSLERRFHATRIRETRIEGKRATAFENAPKPLFRAIRYDRHAALHVFELIDEFEGSRNYPVGLRFASKLIETIRDTAAERLRNTFSTQINEIERVLIGRRSDGSNGGPTEDRIRLIPLPSIGHPEADVAVRRLAVEIPGGLAISSEDVAWAFDNLTPADPETGELGPYRLARAEGPRPMLYRYAAPARTFRSVTPVVLAGDTARRRIEPTRRREEAKGGQERATEESAAAAAFHNALRHAGVRARVDAIRLQREPFEKRGTRAEPFAEGTRFAKERLWHVEVRFDRAVPGPLVIGDGRFLGLGVMAPVEVTPDVHAFVVDGGLVERPSPLDVTQALRRAVMARVQARIGPRERLPAFFTGHARDGAPVRSQDGGHLLFAFLPDNASLLVMAPHVVERRAQYGWEHDYLAVLDDALSEFRELRAGRAGHLALRRILVDREAHPVFAPSRTWLNITPYQVTRHAKSASAHGALALDLALECSRCGLPKPAVSPRTARGVSGVGLFGEAELRFEHPVSGPIVLGRNRHLGGGLFISTSPPKQN
ncbi:MAG: type I-U CRISPR-associated protein Cas5/Cas6 [Labilithrix sp.]|nr:type I-U CRISPR-associated protein Cas5/Cas6 [Labilithrix sp.]